MLECLCSSKAQVDRVHRMSSSWTDVGTWDSLSPAQYCSHFPKWQFWVSACILFPRSGHIVMLLCLFLVPIRSGCDPSFCRSVLEIGGPSSGCHFADAHHFFNVLSAFVLPLGVSRSPFCVGKRL